ncbi:890_t:CDS:10 [Funneliformis geosporum]|nr:890_t:CDS:10 [Funneliformis geosporum]
MTEISQNDVFQIKQLEDLVKQLTSNVSNFDIVPLLINIPNLISGLKSCKHILIDDALMFDEQSKTYAWAQVVKIVELLANAAKNDKNRQQFIDTGGIDVALNCLKQQKDLETIRASSATLLNAGLNYDNVNVGIVDKDGLSTLAEILDPECVLNKYENDIEVARTCVYFATRVIINLIGTAEGKKEIGNTKVITSLVHLLKYASREDAVDDDVDILENVVEILETVALESDDVQQILVRNNLFPILLDFLEFSNPPLNCEQRIIKSYGECKAAVLKVIVSVTMSDSNMDPLFNDAILLNRFLHWLNSSTDRDDLQMCSALSLGNLARTDKHCIQLVHEFKIGEPLADVLRTSSNIKVQHAIISVLKNISLPVENKETIGFLGIIGMSAPLLEQDTVQPVQLGVVGILKHLSSQNLSNSVKVIMGENPADTETPTPLNRLLSLIKRSDEIPVRSEGTRVLVNLVKKLWSENPYKELDGISMKMLRQKLNKVEIVEPLVNMVIESKYPILQNEGIIALTLLLMDDTAKETNPSLNFLTSQKVDGSVVEVSSNTEVVVATAKVDAASASSPASAPPTPTPTQSLLNIITDLILNEKDKYPDEIRSNGCMLLEKASKAACGPQKHYLREKVPPVIKSLFTNEQKPISDRLKSDIDKVLKALD